MMYADPEFLYLRFIRHTLECRTCLQAGGEAAHEGALCFVGRARLNAWGRAERAYAIVNDMSGVYAEA